MKKFDVKKRSVAWVSFAVLLCMMLGLLTSFPAVSVIDVDAAEENIYYEYGDSVVLLAEDMEGRFSGENQIKVAYSKVDGIDCAVLQARRQSGDKNYDPYITFAPAGAYSADDYKYVTFILQSTYAAITQFQVFYKTENVAHYNEGASLKANYAATSDWQAVTFDLSSAGSWKGRIESLRLDIYSSDSTNGERVSIAAIILSKTPEEVYGKSFDFLRDNFYNPVQTLDKFEEDEVDCFVKAEGTVPGTENEKWLASLDTTVATKNGNLIYTYKYDASVSHSRPDPYAGFFYQDLMDERGVAAGDRLDTSDFRYTVIKYRTSGDVGSKPLFETYFYANGNKWPTFINNVPMATSTNYSASSANDWKMLVIDMKSNGRDVGWTGDFNGFRVDWCSPDSMDTTATMEISDIMFFADENDARAFVTGFNNINVAVPEIADYDSFENPIKLTDDCLMMLPDQLAGAVEGSENSVGYVTDTDGIKVLRLETTKTVNEPYVTFNTANLDADEYKFVTVMAKSNVWTSAAMKLTYNSASLKSGDRNSTVARYQASREWTLITIPFDGSDTWKDEIQSIKLNYLCYDPQFTGYGKGVSVDIAGIAFSKTADAFYDSAYYLMTTVYRPEQVLTDFSEADRSAFISSLHSTEVSFANGDLVLKGVYDYGDPWANLNYNTLMDIRGVDAADRLTTSDFNTTVIRYRTSPQIEGATMNLFPYTGEHTSPFKYDDTRVYNVSTYYTPTYYETWRSMRVIMNGASQSAHCWSGAFNGFRIDWCGTSNVGEYMEISEFFFFENATVAEKFVNMMNSLYQPTFGEYNDEFMTSIPTSDDYKIVTPESLIGKLEDSSNSVAYLTKSTGVPVVRFEVTEADTNPAIIYTPEGISADEYKYVTMMIRSEKAYGATFSMNYTTDKSSNMTSQYATSNYSTHTDWQFVTVNLSGRASWKGMVDKLQLGYLYTGFEISEGVTFDVAGLIFSKTEDAVCDAAYYMAAQIYKPTQVLSDFSESDADYFGGAEVSGHTTISFKDGNIKYTAATHEGDADPTVATDPQKRFDYIDYVTKKGIKPLTTSDFGYTVIRYRTEGISSNPMNVELFIFTGDSKSPMIKVQETYTCHSGEGKIVNSDTWRTTVVNMAEDDGYRHNGNTPPTFAWNIEGVETAFNGFRFDWCASTKVGSYMEVSDFIFFASVADADRFSAAVNTVSIPAPSADTTDPGSGDWPFDNPGEGTEESIPDFDNSDETEEPIVTETETETNVETNTETEESENESQEESESETEEGGGNVIVGPSDGNDTDEGSSSGGSQAPFYIVCVALVILSIASLMTVMIIRIKAKDELKDQELKDQ